MPCIRKTGYASQAHEAAAMRKNQQCHLLGDILRYYNNAGEVKVISMSSRKELLPAEFYVETAGIADMKVTDVKTGEAVSFFTG